MVDPYPGESLEYYDAAVTEPIEDFGLYGDVYYRTDVGRLLSAGDVWRFWYSADWQTSNRYLDDPGADVEVSWVVEVNGGAGTLTASEGIDVDYPTTAGTPGTPLGTFTVSGPGTVVIPSALMDASVVVNGHPDGYPMIHLRAESGAAIEVQQVKLRVWPVGGPVGGWVEHPGFDTAPALPTLTGAQVVRSGVTGPQDTPAAAWDAAMTLVAGGASTGGAGPHPVDARTAYFGTTTSGSVSWRRAAPELTPRIDVLASISTTTAQVTATPHGIVAVLAGPNPATANPIAPALVVGVDYVRPPNEIAGDTAVQAQLLGAPAVAWVNPGATIVLTGSATPPTAGPSLSSAGLSTSPVAGGAVAVDMVEGAASVIQSTSTATATVALDTSGRWVAVTVSHSMTATAVPWPGLAPFAGAAAFTFPYVVHFGTGTPGATFAPLMARLSMPAYRVWNPSAAPQVRRVLRQFHRDDGHGVTPPRAFGGASRIRTGRAYGYD